MMSCRRVSRGDDADWSKDGYRGVAEVLATHDEPYRQDNVNTELSKDSSSVVEELSVTSYVPDRNRYDGVSRDDADWSQVEDGGVVTEIPATSGDPHCGDRDVIELLATSYDPDLEDNIKTEPKPRNVDLIAAEISTIDAVINSAAGTSTVQKLPGVINGSEDFSDTASTVSDDTPPSTPSSRGSSSGRHRRRSRRRKPSLQDSHLSISSSPARGLTICFLASTFSEHCITTL